MLSDCRVLVPSMATIETGESDVTGTTLIGNVAELPPAGMVTLSGTVRMPQVDWRSTVVAVSTGPASVIVPVPVAPVVPVLSVAGRLNEASPGSMVTGVCVVTPSTVTEIVVCTGAVTFATSTSKSVLSCPGANVTGGGTKNCRASGSPSVKHRP